MTEVSNSNSEEVAKSFEKVLNRHGYGFHYSVLREARRLANLNQGNSVWDFPVYEFPVEVQSNNTRIDFILHNRRRPLYMIAECKRANPSLAFGALQKYPNL